MTTERNALGNFTIACARGQKREHRLIHAAAIFQHLGERRPGDKSATSARIHRTNEVVIAVEEKIVAGMHALVIRLEDRKHKLLEEPGGMREMPLGRTHVGHRLHHGVFRFEIGGERHRRRTHASVMLGHSSRARRRCRASKLKRHDGSLPDSRNRPESKIYRFPCTRSLDGRGNETAFGPLKPAPDATVFIHPQTRQ